MPRCSQSLLQGKSDLDRGPRCRIASRSRDAFGRRRRHLSFRSAGRLDPRDEASRWSCGRPSSAGRFLLSRRLDAGQRAQSKRKQRRRTLWIEARWPELFVTVGSLRTVGRINLVRFVIDARRAAVATGRYVLDRAARGPLAFAQ